MTTIQVRRGTAAQAIPGNPVLADGEIGFETDTGKLKIGDGSTAWTSLPYATDVSRLPASVVNARSEGGTIAWSGPGLVLALNDWVSYGGSTYLVTTAHTTGSTFNSAYFESTAASSQVSVNPQSGTAYTFETTDNGATVESTGSSPTVFTIPPQSYGFSVGATIVCLQSGAGALSVAAGEGVTLHGTTTVFGQWSTMVLQQIATNVWVGVAPTTALAGAILDQVSYTAPGDSYNTASASIGAVDSTHLTVTFVAPASGTVKVRMAGCCANSGAAPLFAMLDHNTTTETTPEVPLGVDWLVTGLTPGAAYQWDLGYRSVDGSRFFFGTNTWSGTMYPVTIEVIQG